MFNTYINQTKFLFSNKISQYDMHLKQVKFETNTFLNNCGIN